MPSSWTLSYVLPRLYEGWHPQTLGEECSCHKAKGWAQSWRRTNDQMIPGSSRILQKCQNKIAKTRPDLPRAISSWLCSNTSPLRSDGVLWALQLQFVSTPAWWPDGECRARSEVFSQKLRTKQLQIHGFPGSRHCNPSMYQSCHHSLMKIWTIVKYEKCRGKSFSEALTLFGSIFEKCSLSFNLPGWTLGKGCQSKLRNSRAVPCAVSVHLWSFLCLKCQDCFEVVARRLVAIVMFKGSHPAIVTRAEQARKSNTISVTYVL